MRNNKKIIIGILCCALVFMGLAFSLFSSNVNVGSTGNVKGKWDIKIIEISPVETGYAQDNESETAIKDDSGNVVSRGTRADLSATLYAPKDKVVYTIKVHNYGNIKAYLKSIEVINNGVENQYIKVTDTIKSEKYIDAEDEITFDVTIEFLDSTLTEIPSNIDASFTIRPTYVQEANEEDMDIDPSINEEDWTYRINANGEITEYNYSKGNQLTGTVAVPAEARTITADSFIQTPEYDMAMYEGTAIVINNVSGESYSDLRAATLQFVAYMMCNGNQSCMASEQTQQRVEAYSPMIKPEGVTISQDVITMGENMEAMSLQMMAKYANGSLTITNDFSEADVIMISDQEFVLNKTGSDYTTLKNGLLGMIGQQCQEAGDSSAQAACVSVYEFGLQPEGSSVPAYAGDPSYMTVDMQTGNMNSVQSANNVEVLDLSQAVNLETIEASAFQSSDALETLILPDNADLTIEKDAFNSCPNLETVTTASAYQASQTKYLNRNNTVKRLGNSGEIQKISSLQKEFIIGNSSFANSGIESLVLPNNTVTIGASAFSQNALTSVTIPANVETIGDNAFYSNSQLASLYLSGATSLTTIGDSAFEGCSLTSVNIPSGVRTVGNSAFKNNQISSLVIPSSVTDFGNYYLSLYGNTLSSLTLGNCSNVCGIFGASTSQSFDLTIQSGVVSTEDFRGLSFHSLTLGNGVTEIGNTAFFDSSIPTLTLPSSLTRIGNQAFSSVGLTEVTIPYGVEDIGNSAFSENSISGELVLPSSVETIGADAFYNNSITSVDLTVLSSDVSIGNRAFGNNINVKENCNNYCGDAGFSQMAKLDIVSGNIPDYAFNVVIQTVDLGSGVQTVGAHSFQKNVPTLIIGENVTSIDSNAFHYDYHPRNITFKDCDKFCTFNMWGSMAGNHTLTIYSSSGVLNSTPTGFLNAIVKTLNIGEGVTEIGDEVFWNNEISTLTLPSTLQTIGNNAFSSNQITSLTIPANVTRIGRNAFQTQKNGSNVHTLSSITVNMSQTAWNSVSKGLSWYDTTLNPTFTYNP